MYFYHLKSLCILLDWFYFRARIFSFYSFLINLNLYYQYNFSSLKEFLVILFKSLLIAIVAVRLLQTDILNFFEFEAVHWFVISLLPAFEFDFSFMIPQHFLLALISNIILLLYLDFQQNCYIYFTIHLFIYLFLKLTIVIIFLFFNFQAHLFFTLIQLLFFSFLSLFDNFKS